MTPVGRLLLLSKLVGLAVLFLGVGFWYLSERRKPGALASFRWPHFLLLALNYSLFFAAFAVLGVKEATPWRPLALAGLLSLPPLLLHIGRLTDRRFALTRGLPLVLLSLAVVLWGVYGASTARFFYVVLGAALVAFVTVTFPRWSAGRRRQRERRETERQRRQHEAKPRDSVSGMEGKVEQALLLCETARAGGVETGDLEREIASYEDLRREIESLRSVEEVGRHRRLAARLALRAQRLGPALERARQLLDRASSQKRVKQDSESEGGQEHCPSCGVTSPQGRPFCSGCGARQPLVVDCQDCGEAITLLPTLLRHSWRTRPVHCIRCGGLLDRSVKAG